MRKALFVSILAVAMVAMMSSVAYANFGPHGSYTLDTDACAGCHRAHSSFSTVARTIYTPNNPLLPDYPGEEGSALLVGSAQNMLDFCYTCHGEGVPGASTNVEYGVFDSGPSADSLGNTGGEDQLYQTNSTFGTTLNGGGFTRVGGTTVASSQHNMTDNPSSDPIWGWGSSVNSAGADLLGFTCTNCHDPHGSPNYRLLKTSVNGNPVGSYVGDNADPFVISVEEGFPAGGFDKHVDANSTYRPNYTTAEYGYSGDAAESMSGWCAGCHEQYLDTASDYDYAEFETAISDGVTTVGNRTRHRHPMNVNLQGGNPANANMNLAEPIRLTDAGGMLPLEKNVGKTRADAFGYEDFLGCLTCHRAHGTEMTMSGWAQASLDTTDAPVRASTTATWFPVIDSTVNGVNPNHTSALLRRPNRGVCERCHNK